MNKTAIVEGLAKELEIPKTKADQFYKAFMKVLTDVITSNEKVVLPQFGIFKISKRKARVGRNPQTGSTIKIPARKILSFKASSNIRAALNSKK